MKRSITLSGHRTSISLEPEFWHALRELADREGLALSALVARIDSERMAGGSPKGLSSALRLYVLGCYRTLAAAEGFSSALVRRSR